MAKTNRVGLHFLHVSKAGGTTIREIIADQNLRRTAGGRRVVVHAHGSTMPEVLAADPNNSVAFFLRDPVTRFVSGFNGRLRQGAPARSNPWRPAERRAFERFPTPDDLALALYSDDTTTQDHAITAVTAIVHTRLKYAHWFHSREYLERRTGRIMFVGVLEHFDEDATRFFRMLGAPSVVLPHSNQAPPSEAPALSDAGRANVERWYADDRAIYEWALEFREQSISAGAQVG
jgi:hypothetical protein